MDTGCQEAILCTATVMPSCFWIMMFPLSDSRHTTGISVGSEVSLAACWARTDITPACSSDRVPRHPRLSPCESVHRTPTMDGFFIVSSKCCSKVASIPPPSAGRTTHGGSSPRKLVSGSAWSVMLYNEVIQLSMHTNPFFFRFFPHIDDHRILGRVPCALQQVPIGQ